MYHARHLKSIPDTNVASSAYYSKHDEGTAYIPLGDRKRALEEMESNEVEEREGSDRNTNRVSILEWELKKTKQELKKTQDKLRWILENGVS